MLFYYHKKIQIIWEIVFKTKQEAENYQILIQNNNKKTVDIHISS